MRKVQTTTSWPMEVQIPSRVGRKILNKGFWEKRGGGIWEGWGDSGPKK